MRIMHIRTINGPGVYHQRPTLVMTIDLGELTDKSSAELSGFNERLLKALPELHEHFCSPGHAGGFVERLKRGTYLAHIIEHITLALSELAGIGVDFGKSVYHGPDGIYDVVVRFRNEEAMKYLLKSAVEIVRAMIVDSRIDIKAIVHEAKYLSEKEKFGPSTDAIIKAAEKRNIPWQRIGNESLVQLGHGVHRKLIQATTTSETSDIAVEIAQDKNLTKKFLRDAAIKVPRGYVVSTVEELLQAFHKLEDMVVVKPSDGNHGRGVSLRLSTDTEVVAAFHLAQAHSKDVIIEEFYQGKDFRVVIVNGKMIAAAHRIPAHVIGDGASSISELIEKENENPLRGEGHEKVLTKIFMDDEGMFYLNKCGIKLTDIPPMNKVIFLRETANLSTGGIAEDVTDEVHPEIRLMCERASKIIGLDVCGVDLILEDIALPPRSQHGGIIELNAGPGIRMHLAPYVGKPHDIGEAIIEDLFPHKSDGRIPIIAITGTNGKTTVTRLISHILQGTGKRIGTTTTDGIYLGKTLLYAGDTTGPQSAKTILYDPEVEMAVLETARGGIVRRGLGFDWCDVGILLNVRADHLGQDNLETLDDILWVKSLIIERVKKNGVMVLNADSETLMKFIEEKFHLINEGRELYLFSLKGNKDARFYFEGGYLWEQNNKMIHVSDIPITMKGTANHQIENVLAAIAGAKGLGVSDEHIIKGLKSFQNSDNPGRLNLYRVKSGYVLLDYGHNPDAFISVGEMVRRWKIEKITGVIGAPGDRSDSLIQETGKAAAKVFDKIVIREDNDLRGRDPGEATKLLVDGIREVNKNIQVLNEHDSLKALHLAVNAITPGEVIVYFYEDRESIVNELARIGAGVVDHLEENHDKEEMR